MEQNYTPSVLWSGLVQAWNLDLLPQIRKMNHPPSERLINYSVPSFC